jgi:hypothetical protein
MSDNYELDQLIAAAIDSALANVRVALPGVVKSYDAATRTVTVQPAVRRPVEDTTGTVQYEEFPPIQNVPIVFPGAASLTVYFALAAGDIVELVWQDYSPAQWRASGQVSDAPDIHPHGPSYPVAIPWYRPGAGPGSEPDESIGKPGGLRLHFGASAIGAGGQSDFVAMAAKVDSFLSTLQSAIAGVVPAPPSGPDAGEPGLIALQAALASWPGGSVASSNLKAD